LRSDLLSGLGTLRISQNRLIGLFYYLTIFRQELFTVQLSTIHAKNNSAADTLYFYDSKDDGSAIDYIKNATQEDSFDKLRQNYGDFKNIVVEDDEQTLKFKNYSQAAFPTRNC